MCLPEYKEPFGDSHNFVTSYILWRTLKMTAINVDTTDGTRQVRSIFHIVRKTKLPRTITYVCHLSYYRGKQGLIVHMKDQLVYNNSNNNNKN